LGRFVNISFISYFSRYRLMDSNKSDLLSEELEINLKKSTLTIEDTIILGKKVNRSLNKHYIDKTSNNL